MSSRDLGRLSCENLWTVRNTIFDENGFCFSTARGRRAFANDDCSISDPAAVPMDDYERSNVAKVARLESERDCR